MQKLICNTNYSFVFTKLITIQHFQTDEKFEFIVNDWLAVDKGDGQVGTPCTFF